MVGLRKRLHVGMTNGVVWLQWGNWGNRPSEVKRMDKDEGEGEREHGAFRLSSVCA